MDYLTKLNLYEMHIFKFSPRQGTVAAGMKDQVAPEIKIKEAMFYWLYPKGTNRHMKRPSGEKISMFLLKKKSGERERRISWTYGTIYGYFCGGRMHAQDL